MEQKKLFIAFIGPPIDQAEAICKMADGYECWDLKKFGFDGFVAAIQKHIPPVSANFQSHYRRDPAKPRAIFGIPEEQYEASSWGLLLPVDDVPDLIGDAYSETLFLFNLYAPHFLYPSFWVTDTRISSLDHKKNPHLYFHDQKQAHRFARIEFVRYHQALVKEFGYGIWNAYRTARWSAEDWRLFVACSLYLGLHVYENTKFMIMWQRESADMATILEALFTAGSGDNTEVSYKLRKRAAALIGFQVPSVEQEIKKLYKERSSFVHGSFFVGIAKQVKSDDGLATLPNPPFALLYGQKELVRHALIAYLFLNKIHRTTSEFDGCGSVMDILEDAIINLETREKVRRHVEYILSLCADPKP